MYVCIYVCIMRYLYYVVLKSHESPFTLCMCVPLVCGVLQVLELSKNFCNIKEKLNRFTMFSM